MINNNDVNIEVNADLMKVARRLDSDGRTTEFIEHYSEGLERKDGESINSSRL